MSHKIVIFRHGPAGMAAAGFAARTDRMANITVLNVVEQDIYHPCALPFTIGGKLSVRFIIEKDNYQMILLLNNTRVTTINSQEKIVIAVNKDDPELIFEYDVLLIATGSEPLIPKHFIKGWDKEGVCVLKTPQDAQKIIKYAKTAKNTVVIGGSGIGIEVASKLAHTGKNTTLIELMPTLVSGRLRSAILQTVQTLLEAEGITKHNLY